MYSSHVRYLFTRARGKTKKICVFFVKNEIKNENIGNTLLKIWVISADFVSTYFLEYVLQMSIDSAGQKSIIGSNECVFTRVCRARNKKRPLTRCKSTSFN